MNAQLATELQSRYEREGIVFPIEVLTKAEVRRYRDACNDLENQLGGKPRTVEVRQMHLHFPWAYQLVTHQRVLEAVEQMLGPNLLVWATELFVKHANDATVSIRWHRDRTYMGFDPSTTTTAWIALSDSNAVNGCMCAAPGPQRRKLDEETKADGQPPDGQTVLEVALREGEMSLHDNDILHGSSPNQSDKMRLGFVVRYLTPEAQPPHGRPRVILARGHDTCHHFEIADEPRESNPELALAAMRESAAHHLDMMLETIKRTKPR